MKRLSIEEFEKQYALAFEKSKKEYFDTLIPKVSDKWKPVPQDPAIMREGSFAKTLINDLKEGVNTN